MAPSSPESPNMANARESPVRDDADGDRPSKRLRKEENAAAAPQRRQAACQPCRLRKIKCDKRRPTCTICSTGGQECEYIGDGNEKLTLESATSSLLERFDQLGSELASVKSLLCGRKPPAREPSPVITRRDVSSKDNHPPESSTPQESSRDFLQIPPHPATADTVLSWDIFDDKYPRSSLIGTLFSPDPADVGGYSSASSTPANDLITPSAALTPLNEEQIPSLIDRFLQNVHTKNPILDVEALVKHGRRCADQGVGWDGRSCLVLMACALGSIAKPFGRPMPQSATGYAGSEDGSRTTTPSSARLWAKDLQQGDSCFTLACRRLGSLKYSLLGAQCYFFAGVYLMYTLRPLSSWHYFLHASIFFQVHLRMAHGISGDFEEALNMPSRRISSTSRKYKRLEQSFYWSAFKSECEFRVELPLAQSEISLGEYPDMFPSPPSPIAADDPAYADAASSHGAHYGTHGSVGDEEFELRQHAVRLCNEEESWYYYLTEIALRRIGNRIVNTFFRQDRSSWMTNIKPLLRMAQEFEAQVSSWSAHLPAAMQHYETTSIIRAPHLSFENEGKSNHVSRELSWAIDNRLLEMQTWLYQPFLYYFIHASSVDTPGRSGSGAGGAQPRISSLLNPFSPAATLSAHSVDSLGNPSSPLAGPSSLDAEDLVLLHSLIASGIECCLKTIDVRARGHRHHGLWFDLRSIMTASLVLLAIVKSGNVAWIPGGTETVWGPDNTAGSYWNSHHPAPIGGKIGKVLMQFEFWAEEARDLLRYKEVLESVVRDVRGS